jgi:hypothetical protein
MRGYRIDAGEASLSRTTSDMSDTTNYFIVGATPDRSTGQLLPLRTRALLLIVLALAAWVPVLLPLYLLLHR